MRAILVQHGEAVTKDGDPERPLTERGRREVDALATCLSQRGQLPRTIWHSGKTRARQSAELLSAAAPPQARDGLGPNDDTAAWAEQLAQASADLMLVGHQPFVGRLAARQMQHLDPDTQAALRAYADGVNAFLGTDPVLPLEFHILGYAPERWTPADSLSWIRLMALQLSGNYREEIVRAGLAERLDAAQIDFLYPDYPDNGATTLAGLEGLDTMGRQLAALLPPQLEPKSASNAWVLARRNGRGPILANDPHLGLQVPGYWYLTRIETPRRTLVGATAPGMPFHILGRNDAVAWGLTTTHSDTQDLFLEKLDPDDPSRYATPDGWRSFDTRTETIAIEDAEQPVEMTVRTTRHGPVISDTVEAAGTLAGQNRAVALAWPALTADDGTPDALLAVNRAQSVRAALAAMRDVESPQQNVFLADRAGTIAMIAPARGPIRKAGDGTLPRPGWTGEYDWTGWVPTDRPPQAVNPDGGRLVNGNNRIVDGSYPYLIAAHWPPPCWASPMAHDGAGVTPGTRPGPWCCLSASSAAPSFCTPAAPAFRRMWTAPPYS